MIPLSVAGIGDFWNNRQKATKRRGAGLGLAFLWTDAPTERWIEETITAAFGHQRGMLAPIALGEPSRDDVRREHPRAGVCWPCVLRNGEFEVSGWVRDLSEGGAFVEAPRVFGPGRRVEALLWLPGDRSPLILQAVIAHDKRPAAEEHRGGTGIRFVKVDEAASDRLRTAILPAS